MIFASRYLTTYSDTDADRQPRRNYSLLAQPPGNSLS